MKLCFEKPLKLTKDHFKI